MIKSLAIFSALTWMTLIFFVLCYRFEGDLFPVVSVAQITASSIQPHPTKPDWSVLSGTFVKHRNCPFIGIQWNFVAAEDLGVSLVGVPSEFEAPAVHRSKGIQQFDLLAVRLVDQDEILNNSLVYVYHDCFNGWLWNTRTVFYKPRL